MNYTNPTMRSTQNVQPQFNSYTQYHSPVSQPIFPQPSGNVYFVNNNLEVANIPIGAGMSAVLCLPENLLYIKTMQNNMPMLLGYKLSPLEPSANSSTDTTEAPNEASPLVDDLDEKVTALCAPYGEKIRALENTIQELEEKIGGLVKCQF